MPSAGRIVQLSQMRFERRCRPAAADCRGIGAIRSFRVQFRPDRLLLRTNGARLGNVRPSKGLGWVPQMEPTMISLKVLSSAAIMALVVPIVAPSVSFAQTPPKAGGAVGARGGGGGGMRAGGGGMPGGGGMRAR